MFEFGDVVQVIVPGINFYTAFGEVIDTKKEDSTGHTIKVNIHGTFRYMSGAFFKSEREIWYKPEQLEKHPDYPLEVNFPNSLKIYKLENPLTPGKNDCCHENCVKKATKRIAFSIHGIVYEVDVCNIHSKKYHLKWLDNFPWKKSA